MTNLRGPVPLKGVVYRNHTVKHPTTVCVTSVFLACHRPVNFAFIKTNNVLLKKMFSEKCPVHLAPQSIAEHD